MTSYDLKYPFAADQEEPEPGMFWSIDAVLRGRKCEVCGKPTGWISLAYEACVCSEECMKELDEGACKVEVKNGFEDEKRVG